MGKLGVAAPLCGTAGMLKLEVMSQIEVLLKEYLDYLEIEKNRSPKTRENYEHQLQEFLKFARIARPEEITEPLVRDFRIALARRAIGKNTQAYYVIAIRSFLKYLAKHDKHVLAADKIELPKLTRPQIAILDYRDLERLLAAAGGGTLRDLRDRAILETFFSTGLRLSELCNLNRDIDLARGELSVRGKGGKIRVVFLSDRARTTIKTYLLKRTDPEEALFVSLTKKGTTIGRVTSRAVERLVDARAKEAGIAKKLHPHELRHSFATDLLINGADIRAVQELLGHASISTTQIYTHLTNKELREIHEAFHGRRRKEK